jgi:DNA-binding GntR family transcriptional regulator
MPLIETKPIITNSLADIVASRLREAIVTGQFQPGEKLSELGLTHILGVSRSPVREALQQLENEGLVVSKPNRSTCVWKPTETDLWEIYTLRSTIETLAGELVFDKLTSDDFHNLEAIIWNEGEAVAAGDFAKLIKEDRNFHEYIVKKSNHKRLIETWLRIIGQWELLSFIRFRLYSKSVPRTVMEDHKNIIKALKDRDIAKLSSLNREINERVMREIIKIGVFNQLENTDL